MLNLIVGLSILAAPFFMLGAIAYRYNGLQAYAKVLLIAFVLLALKLVGAGFIAAP